MATLTIPADTFERLARRAEALGTTVEALALPALELAARPPQASPEQSDIPPRPSPEESKRILDGIVARAQARAHRYPPGFECDVSRESIYEARGE